MLPGWDPNLAFGDGSGTSEVPVPDFDDFFAGLPSGFDAPQAMSESGRPKVVAEGSRIINGFFSIKLATINSSLESNPDAALSIETHGSLKIDLQSNVQMGFGDVQQQSSNNSCSEATLQMKPQPCEEGVLFCFNNMP
ncbi:hypothetical protein Bca52824_053784 [Brassica carinata]|uniref:Uncharacterized protein n=1 Tax=Brassica carinata TaxID=52824 RepID=A0A8X7RC94_BRACI|nr:hypothetical protein Bca52824_053784 [Brassica carinata]